MEEKIVEYVEKINSAKKEGLPFAHDEAIAETLEGLGKEIGNEKDLNEYDAYWKVICEGIKEKGMGNLLRTYMGMIWNGEEDIFGKVK